MKDSWALINRLAKYQFGDRFVLRWVLDFFEFLLVLVSVPITIILFSNFPELFQSGFVLDAREISFYTLFLVVFWYSVSHVLSMANHPRAQRFLNAIFLFIRGYFFIFLLQVIVKLVFFLQISFAFILINIGLAFSMHVAFRITTMYFARIYRASGNNLRRVLIIGDGSVQYIIEKFIKQKDWGYEILGVFSKSRKIRELYQGEFPILYDTQNLPRILENQIVDEVFYSRRKFDAAELRYLAHMCDEIGVIFRVQAADSCLDPLNIKLRTFNKNGKLPLVDIPSHRLSYEIKTVTDVIFSFFGLAILFPFLLLIALMIKLDSPGSVFFKQERIGLRGRRFKLWKFRTMVANAEEVKDKLKNLNESDGPAFKIKNDPRITRLGRFLRKTGIDEIPQLINVLKGDMSLIGPRPPIESEVKQYKRWQLRRLSVKPGITCIWQTAPNRNDIHFDKWMQMDLNYIDNWSLKMDIKLVFRTISAMVFAYGR